MSGTAVRLADQGYFFVGVTFENRDGQTLPDNSQIYVEYQKPEVQTQPYPVVLVHGGGSSMLDWTATPDGRPGWRTLLLQQGYTVYLVDRPSHGRSPNPASQAPPPGPGLVPSVETVTAMFANKDDELHTQWPGTSGDADDEVLAQLLAGQGTAEFDLSEHHALIRERFGQLLDRIGPAFVITSSAGGPSGWLMADARPDLVKGIVGLEPLGPSGPFPLTWGLAAAQITYDPPVASADELSLVDVPAEGDVPAMKLQADPPRRLANLADIPIAIVTAERTFATAMDTGTVAYLRQGGCGKVDHLFLEERGVRGNGHLMMIERNNDEVLNVVTEWLGTAAK